MSRILSIESAWLKSVRCLLAAGLLNIALPFPVLARLGVQGTSAAVTGMVVDATGAVLPGVTITVVNEDTSARREVHSASDGSFAVPTLAPGRYLVLASLAGFQPSELRDIILNVDDRLRIRLELLVAGMDETVTVSTEARRINTSPGVSTVIDRKFVENLPLNGRSLQALLELTPGVVLTRANNASGQFSVNGQRTMSNYITVDGVSATAGASTMFNSGLGAGGSGQLPGLTSVGGTSGLVSVDALQEFRIQTSGFAPEFGRTPGGQVSFVTRSGTNKFHGSAFEYFRDDALDATDWFLNRSGQGRTELRQHNFGGVLGGPVLRNRTFAFGSYERLELMVPQVRTAAVPTLVTRSTAAPAVRPYLDAMPLPNSRDLGNGFANFVAVYSDPSEVDSRSIRVDHNIGSALKLFGRFSDAPSFSEARGASYGFSTTLESNNRSGTIGSTWLISKRIIHDVRVGITKSDTPAYTRQAPLGGASMLSPAIVPSGRDPDRTSLTFFVNGGGTAIWGPNSASPSRQVNVVDSLTLSLRSHEIKLGVDFRNTISTTSGEIGRDVVGFDITGLATARATSMSMVFTDNRDRRISFDNLSVYAQDHWRPVPRLTLSYGVRWELVPPPDITGVEAVTLDQTDNILGTSVGLDTPGVPLWKTTYGNVAPRFAASYLVSDSALTHLLVKGGVGTFFDLGYGLVGSVAGWAYPYSFTRSLVNVTLPLNPDLIPSPVFGIDAPSSTLTVMDRNLRLPYTLQWNLSADQGIGRNQSLTVSYIGARGRHLLRSSNYRTSLRNWPSSPMTTISLFRNNGYSDYQALQFQFNRRLSRGVQAIVSYTLGRSRDTGSSEAVLTVPTERLAASGDFGYSSYDVRHVFSAAWTYQLPEPTGPRLWRALAKDWGADFVIRARSGSPIDMTATVLFPPLQFAVRPNVVPGQPFWVDDPTAPGGRRLNRQAFSIPPTDTQGDLPRSVVRGFGLSQVDLAIRREIQLVGRVRLQLRFEAFNLLNTPNFADPTGRVESADFGVSTQMLGRSLGGQNVLYQIGGARSIQLATKVHF